MVPIWIEGNPSKKVTSNDFSKSKGKIPHISSELNSRTKLAAELPCGNAKEGVCVATPTSIVPTLSNFPREGYNTYHLLAKTKSAEQHSIGDVVAGIDESDLA